MAAATDSATAATTRSTNNVMAASAKRDLYAAYEMEMGSARGRVRENTHTNTGEPQPGSACPQSLRPQALRETPRQTLTDGQSARLSLSASP